MNYDDHLEKFESKQKELANQAEAEKQRRLIALEEAYKESDQIINSVVLPELDILRGSLVKHGFPAKIKATREVSELSPDSTFDIGIELSEETAPGNSIRGITFSGVPHGKYFNVRMIVTQNRNEKADSSELKFSDTTADSVKAICARFVQRTFRL